MAVYLIESKADQQKLIDHVGEDTAKLFFMLKNRLKSPENDIYFWLKRSPEILKRRLDDLQSIKTRSQKDAEASEGAELVYSGDGWKVYHITTYEASKKYGSGTKWCISGSKVWSNGERGEEYFNQYTSKGVEFYFYIKDGAEKYALAYVPQTGKYQIFDARDYDISQDDLSFLPKVEGLPVFSIKEYITDDGTFIYNDITLTNKIPGIQEDIKHLIVGDNIKSIPDGLFAGCMHLRDVQFSDSLTYIGMDAFYRCSGLTRVHLPDSIQDLGYRCFAYCNQLEGINIPNNSELVKIPAYMLCDTSVTELTIPDNIKEIGVSAFSSTPITHLTLPEGMKAIRSNTFRDMSELESIVVPSTIYGVYERAFSGCYRLKSIDLSNTEVVHIGQSAFSQCFKLEEVLLPESLSLIEQEAFVYCTHLKSIRIPSHVDTIEQGAFMHCRGLTDVYLENTSVTSLGGEVFKGCTLSNLTIHVSGPQKDFIASAILAEYDGKINLDIGDN